VVWSDNRDGNDEIYYKRSTDAGVSWGSDIRLTDNSAFSGYPSVSVSGSVVHVSWEDYRDGNVEIYYKRSTDAGMSWSSDIRLTNNTAFSRYPSISTNGNLVHVVWHDTRDGSPAIYYKRSTNSGTSWSSDIRLRANSLGGATNPSISLSGLTIHVVWSDNRDANYEIYYKRSTDGGTTWQADTRLTNNSAYSSNPSVSVFGSLVNVVWYDDRDGNYEIYYKRSTDGGSTWQVDTRLTNNSEYSYYPSVSTSFSAVHVIWQDYRDGNGEIYYKRSTDAGLNWEADTRLTNNSANSWYPCISVSDSVVHVVWYDDRDGNNEIYYKRNPTGNPIPRAPVAPVLYSPGNNTQGWESNLTLVWYKVPAATNYTVQLAIDSLMNWTLINDSTLTDSIKTINGLPNNSWYYWRVNARNVAGTGPWSEVWRFRIGYIGIQPISNKIPERFCLYDNYPNPFNAVTRIEFDIPTSSYVKLTVYDMLGREVSRPVEQRLEAGRYMLNFDASSLSSGAYFYRIEAGEFTESKAMIVTK